MHWQKLYNPSVSWLLRSPLHGLMNNSTMLITFAGRKSGKTYTTPLNYVRDDHTLQVVSPKDRTPAARRTNLTRGMVDLAHDRRPAGGYDEH